MDHYFPSCKFTALFPAVSEKAKAYAGSQGMAVDGCCRVDHGKPEEGDRIYCVCTNCSLILGEASEAQVGSLLEHISQDSVFPFPDRRGQTFVIQHCAKADTPLRETVCQVVSQMGGTYNVGQSLDYCGTNFMKHMTQRNLAIAPRTFSKLEKRVVLLDKVQQEKKLQEMIERYGGKPVITYCNSCYEALKQRGVEVFHLMELLFADYIGGVTTNHG